MLDRHVFAFDPQWISFSSIKKSCLFEWGPGRRRIAEYMTLVRSIVVRGLAGEAALAQAKGAYQKHEKICKSNRKKQDNDEYCHFSHATFSATRLAELIHGQNRPPFDSHAHPMSISNSLREEWPAAGY